MESSDDDGEIDHLSVEEWSSTDISNNEDQDTSTIFMSQNKKENWSATPHTNNIGRTATCNIYHDGAALYALQNRNAIQCPIHADYCLEANGLKKFVIGQMLKDYFFTKTSRLL